MKKNKLVVVSVLLVLILVIHGSPTHADKTTWFCKGNLHFIDSEERIYVLSMIITGDDAIYLGVSTSYMAMISIRSLHSYRNNVDSILVTHIEILYGKPNASIQKNNLSEVIESRLYDGMAISIVFSIIPSELGSFVALVIFHFRDSLTNTRWRVWCATAPQYGHNYVNVLFPWFLIMPIIMMVVSVITLIFFFRKTTSDFQR